MSLLCSRNAPSHGKLRRLDPARAEGVRRQTHVDARRLSLIRGHQREQGIESNVRKRLIIAIVLWQLAGRHAWAVDPPCDAFPPAKQIRCMEIWKDLYNEDGPAIAQFGLDQLKRREEGKITAQEHLAQNMDYIKHATERRLARLNERMAKE
jgi:hypothetical protein